MLANFNPEDVAALIKQCAHDIIMPYHNNLADGDIDFKNGDVNNKVTVADRMSEEFLTEKLLALLPGSEVVGEEAVADDEDLLEHLVDKGKTVWVIDPIDGTSNFTRGSETFCVIVALVHDGETKMGWIYDPCRDSMAFAEKGKGAFIDGVQMDLSNVEAGDEPKGYAGHRYSDRMDGIAMTTLRCSGLEYVSMAKGEALFSVYRMMKPWDHLAGTLLVQEAGGLVAKWDHSAYKPDDDRGGLITAVNQDLWRKVRSSIPDNSLKKEGLSP